MTAGGMMDMVPEQVEPRIKALADTGTTLASGWEGAKAAIAAAEGGIGSGPLAEAFRANYAPATQAVRTAADPVPGEFQYVASAGSQGVADYRSVDQPGLFGFPS
ncbi:hypothetical protein BWI15_28510 [Kribbella sp. ALI-6-A]|uniref:hypothetical protein n=1 Tax=Kribbella sp. ALI-6-A TaxID=1933817 RepID=UPI00097C8D75|nr:hypothetical protein [Kribbella sp. ALI-6-A]ONI67113.1 hypothetical protein BWI15_28510 [Kribbella sp. ALI-6-A]